MVNLKRHITSLCVVSLFVLIFVYTSFGQSPSHLDSLNGKYALQFQIDDNFTLRSFQGTTFSGKYHFSKNEAVRVGLTLEIGNSDIETKLNMLDTSALNKSEEDYNKFGITINSQYQKYFSIDNSIAFFGGVGPFITIYNSDRERTITYNGAEEKAKSETNTFSVGADLIAGVEWWFYKQMSLSAEYGLEFAYWSSTNKSKSDTETAESESNSFSVNGNSVKFGISVYF